MCAVWPPGAEARMAASTLHPVARETTAESCHGAPARPSGRVPELDGIRGIAILLVLGAHFATPVCPPGIVREMFGFGWAGVDLFFVLSGLLITGILLDAKGKPDYFRRFYLRRVFRIFPIYYAYLILFFHVVPLIAHATGRFAAFDYGRAGEVWYWTYLSNWRDPVDPTRPLGHFWSLSIEEQFYIVWPLVVYLIPMRMLKYVCASLSVLSPALRLVAGYAGISGAVLYRTTPFRLEGLALGALLALAERDEMLQKRLTKLIRWAWRVAAAALAVVLMRYGTHDRNLPMAMYGYLTIALLCWALVSCSISQTAPTSWTVRCLRNSWLVRLGKYSYGLYVWHLPIAAVVHGSAVALRAHFGMSWSLVPTALILGIAASYAVALVSWKLIEEPCARLKERVAA
jgi:peptidoglycan/LPS O-acetylase OafA/YrhL